MLDAATVAKWGVPVPPREGQGFLGLRPWPPLPHNFTGAAWAEAGETSQARAMDLLHGSRLPAFRDMQRTYTEAMQKILHDDTLHFEPACTDEALTEVEAGGDEEPEPVVAEDPFAFAEGTHIITSDNKYGTILRVHRPAASGSESSSDLYFPGLPPRFGVCANDIRLDPDGAGAEADEDGGQEFSAAREVLAQVQKPWRLKAGHPS